MVGLHFTDSFADLRAARTASRRLRSKQQYLTSPQHCEDCKAWHLVLADKRFDEVDRVVLQKIAMGFRSHEIARDIGETNHCVDWRIKHMIAQFNALSRVHLVVLAIYFGLVDLRSIANCEPEETKKYG